ncbi:MAG: NAD-dependent epimerase/dehydratase family protein [Desulfobacteraceae bacterium]|nr:NAD-dependent epimerase/dehydratase family protein [Desulfobacteraceae bacterium]
MSILITGGTGFLGAGLARRLLDRGEEVVLFDVVPRIERVADIKDKVKVVQGDLKVWPEVLNVVKENNVEGIFHLGAMLSLPSEDNPWASYQTNVAGTMHVLEAARLFGVKRMVFASSAGTYGLGTGDVITDETIQRPINMYGIGKLFGELLGRFYRRKFGLDFRSVRYCGVVIGPGYTTKAVPIYIPWMIEHAALGKPGPFECWVSEDAPMQIMYFKDIVKGTEMLYYAPKEQIKMVCYNLSAGSQVPTVKDVEMAIKKFVPEAEFTYKPDPVSMEFIHSLECKSVDYSRATEEWGWDPQYTDYEKIVEDFINEARTNPELYGLKT